MGTHSRAGRRFVDGVRALQQIVAPLAKVSNYPGVFAPRWVQYRAIAPSAGAVVVFNIWLVLTSALEWIAVDLVVRSTNRLRSRSG